MRVRTAIALLFAVLIARPVWAQEQVGSIEGVVKDAQEKAVPGATVEARSQAGAVLSTTSSAEGGYRFPSVQPGTYEVTAKLTGFSPAKTADIVIAVGQIKKVDFTLKVGGVNEQVTVTGAPPVIDVRQSTRATNIRAEQVELLPHGRDFTSLVTMAPGANLEVKAGCSSCNNSSSAVASGISIDGASGAENRYIVDGVETTDLIHGQSGLNILPEFVDEVQVKSSGYPAEFGGATGGVISVITKSGTNKVNGNLLMFLQGDKLRGNPRPTLRLNPSNSKLAEEWSYPDDKDTRFEPGGSVGAPIIASKAWFFVAYQPTLRDTKRTVDTGTSGFSGASTLSAERKRTTQFFSANETMQLGTKLRTRIAFNNSRFKDDGLLPALSGVDDPSANYSRGTVYPNWALSGNADYVMSQRFVLGARAGYYLSDSHDLNVPDQPVFFFNNFETGAGTTNIGMAGVPANLQHGTSYTSLANTPSGNFGNFATTRDKQTRTFFQADATWFAHAGGDHQVRAGLQVDRRANDVLSGELKHVVYLHWGQPFGTDIGTFGTYSVRTNAVFPEQGFVTAGDVHSNVLGLFIQDEWRASQRLTVNLGIRTENEKVPAFTTGGSIPSNPIQFGFGDKVAPRAGFAYDLKGDGKSKVYGSWGIFYDIFKMNLPRGSFGGDKWVQYYYTLDTPNYESVGVGTGCPPACPGRLLGSVDERQPSVTPGVDIETNLKPMKSQELAFGYERQLEHQLAFSARFVHKQLDRGIEDVGAIDPVTGAELYIIANPGLGLTQTFNLQSGRAVYAGSNGAYTLPKPTRNYNGLEFTLEKRLAQNWFFRGSYLLSRDSGTYPGLGGADEPGVNTGVGRSDPNTNRIYDYPIMSFMAGGKVLDGPLPTDRTHQIKMQGIYQTRWGTTLGINEFIASGIPMTTELRVIPGHNYPFFYQGRGDLGRMPVLSQTDLYVQHAFKLGGTRQAIVNFNVLNLFNQDTATDYFPRLRASGTADIPEAAFYAGTFDVVSYVNSQLSTGKLVPDPRFVGTGTATDPTSYKPMSRLFQDPITARFGFKITF